MSDSLSSIDAMIEPLGKIPAAIAELNLGVPHLEQYFGIWAVLEEPFRAAVDRVGLLNLRIHVETQQQKQAAAAASGGSGGDRREFALVDGIAVISLSGAMMKQSSSLSQSTSTVFARRQIRQAAADPDVRGILLRIDSPGGTVSGTGDLAADVAAAATKKKVVGYVEDLCASAAYWVASQCTRVMANATALVGSIGIYGVLQDWSGYAAKEGIKVHVVRAGEFKGTGVEGTEITQKQLADYQRIIDDLNEHFVRGVAAGRKMSLATVRELADGRIHVAAEAQAKGLIDAVGTIDEALSSFPSKSSQSRSSAKMSDAAPTVATVVPESATYEQLVASCVGADPAFLCKQLGAKATVAQAMGAWMAEQNARLSAAREEADKAKAQSKKPGVEPITHGKGKDGKAAFEGDPISAWEEALEAKLAKCGNRANARRSAVTALVKENPELHQAYIEAYNVQNAHLLQKGNQMTAAL